MIICMVSTESLRVELAGCILMPFDYTMQSSVICAHIPQIQLAHYSPFTSYNMKIIKSYSRITLRLAEQRFLRNHLRGQFYKSNFFT